MGRPSFQPTADQKIEVAALAQAHVALDEIARRIGVTKKTLLKHFAVELGRENAQDGTGEKPGGQGKTPPPYLASSDDRQAVEILAACKTLSREEIADHLGITVPMLDHHFADELRLGPTRKHTEVIIATHKAAAAGQVSAQRLWFTIRGAFGSQAGNAKPTSLGKKDQATAAAHQSATPGNKFAPPAAPKLVVDNR